MFNFASILPSATTTTMLPWMASTYTSLVMLRSMIRDFIPPLLQEKIFSIMARLYAPSPRSMFTLVIDEYSGCKINEMYEAAETYSRAKINTPSLHRLAVSKQQDEKSLVFRVAKDEDVVDVFQDIPLTWKFLTEKESNQPGRHERRYFELIFSKRHKELVISAYLPHVMETSKAIMQENLTLRLYSYGLQGNGAYGGGVWGSIEHDHPATFDTLAMDEDLKRNIIQDLDRFLERREYYRRVGKAWKRGYLLYGPPGTGKSSLIAAMANYLNFNIYDVELTAIRGNAHLRNLLVATKNRSIIVIEDIDCSTELKDRRPKADEEDGDTEYNGGSGLTLSGLLSSIDGLWSSCGEERIIIFTTNHKDRIDPALLRPGRMDMHIHMSYCTASGFKILASNYLGLSEENRGKLYSEIADQIEESQITPAEVAEELMRSEDADTALAGLHECLKRKRTEEEYKQNQCLHEPKQASKRRKVDDGNEMASITRMAGRRNVNHLRPLPTRMAGKGI